MKFDAGNWKLEMSKLIVVLIFLSLSAVSSLPSVNAVPIHSEDILAYYRFEEGNGSILKDSSQYACDGTNMVYADYQPGAGNDSTGQYCLFYHDCFYSDIGYCINPTSLNPFTLGAWVNVSYSPDGAWVFYNIDGLGNGMELDINNFGQPHFVMCTASACLEEYADNPINYLEWTHVIVTFNNTKPACQKVNIYVNGVDQVLTCLGDSISGDMTSTTSGLIGILDATGYCTYGMIDELFFFNNSISSGQAQQLYTEGVSSVVSIPNPVYIPQNTTIQSGVCPETLESIAILWLLVAIAFVLLIIGLISAIFGIMGSLILLFDALTIFGCSPAIGSILFACGLLFLIWYAMRIIKKGTEV
jgi:hypothetical protein